jgi:DNA topoisomerase-1
LEAAKFARKAGLRYITDQAPGFYRLRKGESFFYTDSSGARIKDKAVTERIKMLVIPPAWEKVWISPYENSHLQVTGLDSKQRKQYRYHPAWSKTRNETKFYRMANFFKALPAIRQKALKDSQRKQLDKQKVLGTIICLMEKSHIRIGNKEYAKQNKSFGLTTMRDRHVKIKGEGLEFEFVGKKGVKHKITLKDKRLARIVSQCRDIPGHELFQYYDKDGKRHCIDSGDVNEYIKEISGKDFTTKDFRTWAGTIMAFRELKAVLPALTFTKKKGQVVEIIKTIAGRLGNTVSVCRKYYIHPSLFEAFLDGSFHTYIKNCKSPKEGTDIDIFEEQVLVNFLRQK